MHYADDHLVTRHEFVVRDPIGQRDQDTRRGQIVRARRSAFRADVLAIFR